MPDSWATISDYFTFIGEVEPSDMTEAETLRLNAVLRRASGRVSRAIRLARIPFDSDGYPKPAKVRKALADATCSMTQGFETEGNVTGAEADYDSVSMAGVTLSKRAGSASESSTQKALPGGLTPEAYDILVVSGIFDSRVAGR